MPRTIRATPALLVALALVLLPVTPAAADTVPPEPTPAPAAPSTATTEPTEPAQTAATDPAPSSPAPTDPVSSDPVPEPDAGRFEVDDAELRWGVNHESNNRAFAPGTFNFFSAGKIADPGRGGAILPESGWSAAQGNVTIEKQVGTTYQRATWAGLRTDSAGVSIPSPTSGRFSNHQVVVGGGTGEIDTDDKTATIRWDGDFTVVYYSGYSFFHVSDPVLVVKDGRGTLSATLSGFASSMEDQSQWEAVPARTVTLANLPKVALTAGGRGFTADVAYAGVRVSGVDQVTTGPDVGSFPQSFVDFQKVAGSAAYWYSSGGSTDAQKAALPVTISYDRGRPIAPPVTAPKPGATADAVTNPLVSPPSVSTVAGTPPATLLPAAAAAPVTVAAASAVATDAAFVQAGTSTLTADQIAARTASAVWWWLGAVLLTLAAGSVAGAVAYSSLSTSASPPPIPSR